MASIEFSDKRSNYVKGSYYYNDGTDWQVGAKAGLDVTMTVVGFLGPVGFGISATYFLLDTTGSFWRIWTN